MDKLQLHPYRRSGRGDEFQPVGREEGACVVENCPNFIVRTRLTKAGFYVGYCQPHFEEAQETFGE